MEKKLVKKIREEIKQHNLRMKPKVYFLLKNILVFLFLFAFIFLVVFIASFVIFTIEKTNILNLYNYGWGGIKELFSIIPWILFVLILLLWLGIEIIAKKFALVYRRPLIVTFIVIVSLTFIIAFGFNKCSLHKRLFNKAKRAHIPLLVPFYNLYWTKYDYKVYLGEIVTIQNDYLKLSSKGQKIEFYLRPNTKICGELKEGEKVIVFAKTSTSEDRHYLSIEKIKTVNAKGCRFGSKRKKETK